MKSKTIAKRYQEFSDFLNQEHCLTLTVSEMDEIIVEAQIIIEALRVEHAIKKAKNEKKFILNETPAQKERKKFLARIRTIIETRTE